MQPFAVRCGHCEARLKISDPRIVGKQIPCPRCKNPLRIEAPAAVSEQPAPMLSELLEPDDTAEPEPVHPAAQLTRQGNQREGTVRRGAHRGQQDESGRSAWKVPVLVGGAGLLIAAVVVAVVALSAGSEDQSSAPHASSGAVSQIKAERDRRPSRNKATQKPGTSTARKKKQGRPAAEMPTLPLGILDLAYLPPDADVIISLRVADLWKTPLAQTALAAAGAGPQRALKRVSQATGLRPVDVESVVLALRHTPGNVSTSPLLKSSPTAAKRSHTASAETVLGQQGEQKRFGLTKAYSKEESPGARHALTIPQSDVGGRSAWHVPTGPKKGASSGRLMMFRPHDEKRRSRSNERDSKENSGENTKGRGRQKHKERKARSKKHSHRKRSQEADSETNAEPKPSKSPSIEPIDLGEIDFDVPPVLAVVRTVKPYDESMLLAWIPNHDVAAQDEEVYYVVDGKDMRWAVYFADPRTVVLGSVQEVQAAIGRGSEPPPMPPALAKFNGNYHVVVAMLPPEVPSGTQASMGKLVSAGFVAHVTDGLYLQMVLNCKNEADAQQMLVDVDAGLAEVKKSLATAQGMLPPALALVANEVVAPAGTRQDGRLVEVTSALPPGALQPQMLVLAAAATNPLFLTVRSKIMPAEAQSLLAKADAPPEGRPTDSLHGDAVLDDDQQADVRTQDGNSNGRVGGRHDRTSRRSGGHRGKRNPGKLQVGDTAPDFSGSGVNRRNVRLENLRGEAELVLLHFWSFKKEESMQELVHLRDLYNRYRERGLRVIAICVGNSRKDRRNRDSRQGEKPKPDELLEVVVDRVRLNYLHVFEQGRGRGGIAKSYNVNSLPQTFLLDSELTIIAKGLLGGALDKKIEELLEPRGDAGAGPSSSQN